MLRPAMLSAGRLHVAYEHSKGRSQAGDDGQTCVPGPLTHG
jgi:hypothetical protein